MKLRFKNIALAVVLVVSIFSCSDNLDFSGSTGTYISLGGINTRSHQGNHPGDNEDYTVYTLRVIAFDKTTEMVKSNIRYNAHNQDIIQHPIGIGSYKFVFLANEPLTTDVESLLTSITNYSDLNNIAFSESAFSSTLNIPMIQNISEVDVLANGEVQVNGGSTQSILLLNLNRMAVRLDMNLEAQEDLSNAFKGINLSGLPNLVPLFPSSYTGSITRNISRSYTIAENPTYFTHIPPSTPGDKWEMNISRVVVPSNDFMPKNSEDKAVTLTVNLEDKYSPYCKLRIEDTPTSDYTLPQNTKLDIKGIIKTPLELNIEAAPWNVVDSEWDIDNRLLNVSIIKTSITDFNGVRISFWSNMSRVRVLPYVTDISTSSQLETNVAFNDLAITNDNPNPTRFHYNQSTGEGYMDILVDGGKNNPNLNQPRVSTYKLILAADDDSGLKSLEREITITVNQNGTRPNLNPWGSGYTGGFYRNKQIGERIFTGQHLTGVEWKVTVPTEFQDFIKVSSTPSFDPDAGTDNPGDPEKYPVFPESQKNETGSEAHGKGRIYFKMGLKGENANAMPRYGYVEIMYSPSDDAGNPWMRTDKLYIRQGEEADYVYRPSDLITEGVLAGKSRTAARKFTPYNLTSPDLKSGNESRYSQLNVRGAVFVDYPTQTGAFFAWATLDSTYIRRAYHPTKDFSPGEWSSASLDNNVSGFWEQQFKAGNEVSPKGYSRPNDGYEDRKAYNGNYWEQWASGSSPDPIADRSDEIIKSTFRVSLFYKPIAGNLFDIGVSPTYPQGVGNKEDLPGTRGGLYADGFFDRRPITNNAVSNGNANIAYGGLLIYNEATNASLFFPSGGRRNVWGTLQFEGTTGYYWTTSVGPWLPDAHFPAWGFELAFWSIGPTSQLTSFGQNIRCIKE